MEGSEFDLLRSSSWRGMLDGACTCCYGYGHTAGVKDEMEPV
jgi:hypothetical protein